MKKPSEGANYGNVAEGVFAVALLARFSSGRVKRDTTAFDVYNLIRKISYSPMPGRTSVKAILNESAPNEGISATDNIICTITLAKVNMDFLINIFY